MAEILWLSLFFLLPAPPALDDKNEKDAVAAALKSITKKKIFGVERAIDIPGAVFPSQEAITEMEQGMEGCEHLWFDSCYGGAKLHYRKWLPKNKKPKGIILWLHGISAHSGRALVNHDGKQRKLGMALQCEEWVKAGYALYAFDYYGHGYSEGIRWFVPRFEVNRDDIITFTKLVAAQHDENTPLILTAESYGGCLALHVAKYFQENPGLKPKGFDSIILQAPAIVPPDLPPKPVVMALVKMAEYYPTWIPFFMPNPVSTSRIWKDEKVKEIIDSKERREMLIEGGGRPYRLATAVSLLTAMEQVREDIIPGLTVPFCVIHGEQDIAVPVAGTELLIERASSPKSAVLRHPEAYHDLMADPVAEETMKFMIDFVNGRVASFGK